MWPAGAHTSRITVAPNTLSVLANMSRLVGAGKSGGSRMREARLVMQASSTACLLGKAA